ncbi:PadR family transcriptional regulator [Streptomyces thermocoprophilus]|uniref:PadR family transcriptional regulator n=1 Tax=Streptomyces thermocoprophilus TaxID=78356 RepID=A0ABV5VNQ2_9ACTN
MSVRHILLGLLASGPSHGYELKRRHDERFPQSRPLAYGQVYTTLQRLVRDGLAEVDGTASDGGPERTAYRATDEGRRELARWAGEIAPPAPSVTNEIFAKVVALMLTGGDAGAYLLAQRAAHSDRMGELTALKTASGTDLTTVLSADYALNHLDADLRWMTTTAARLTTLTTEIRAACA